MKVLVGYARVSTLDQNPQLQIDALSMPIENSPKVPGENSLVGGGR
jgi:hypothetical protein